MDELPGLAAKDADAAKTAKRQISTFYTMSYGYRMLIDCQHAVVSRWEDADLELPTWVFDDISTYGSRERWRSWREWWRPLQEEVDETYDAINEWCADLKTRQTNPATPSQE